jgi:hypothetical protein
MGKDGALPTHIVKQNGGLLSTDEYQNLQTK